MSWIKQVLDETEEAESPRAFVYWSALTAIAAVMRKNVWIDKHLYKLYPNIYVLLIAKSGMRKAFPVTLAKRLVRLTKVTRVIAGRNTIQAILTDLSKAYTIPNGRLIEDGHGFLCAGEFSSFIIRDQDALTILTDLYDTYDHEPEYRTLLKSGNETIYNPCVTMLGASNQTHLRDKISEIDTDGGFVGRTLMIVAEGKYKLNPLMEEPEHKIDFDSLAEHLIAISKLTGKFEISPEAKKVYTDWYLDFNSREHDDRTGTTNRIHDHILKVSMLIALSHSLELVINAEDMQMAIDSCLSFMVNVNKTIMPGNKSALAEPTKLVMSELLSSESHQITRSKLLQKMWGDLDAFDLDRIVETLSQAGLIIIAQKGGQGVSYSLSPAAKNKYLELKKSEVRN